MHDILHTFCSKLALAAHNNNRKIAHLIELCQQRRQRPLAPTRVGATAAQQKKKEEEVDYSF